MRRVTIRFCAFALVFLASAFSFATVTVSGTLVDPATGLVSSRAKVRFVIHCNGAQPVVTGTGVIIPGFTEFTPNASGVISGTVYSSATEISCGQGNAAGTGWYGVIPYYDGKPGPEVSYTISGASWNYNSATPNTIAPTVTAPTGDSTYVRLDGGNNPTGIISPSTNGTLALGGTSARWDANLNDVDTNSYLKFRTSSAPTCASVIGYIYFDSSANRFKVCENGGAFTNLQFLPSDYGNATWGSGSGFTWTFDASSGTDSTFVFGNNTLTLSAATITQGGTVTTAAGSGASAGTSGTYRSGNGGATGNGGTTSLLGGNAGGGNGFGGAIVITGGTGAGSSGGGDININAGASGATANGAQVIINAGAGGATSGNGGTATLQAGSGTAGASNGGDVSLSPGAKSGAGTPGRILIAGNAGTASVGSTDQAALYYDTTADRVKISENGGTYSTFTVSPCITSQKSESAADTNVLTCTPPAVAGSYRIRFTEAVSAQNTATLGWTATWKDANGSAQAPTNLSLFKSGTAAPALTFVAATNDNYYATLDIDVDNSATAIVVKTTFAGTSFTSKVTASIERIN